LLWPASSGFLVERPAALCLRKSDPYSLTKYVMHFHPLSKLLLRAFHVGNFSDATSFCETRDYLPAADSETEFKGYVFLCASSAPRNEGDEIRARLLWVRQEGKGPAKRAGRDRDTVVAITTLAPRSPGPVPFFARTHGPRLNVSARNSRASTHAHTTRKGYPLCVRGAASAIAAGERGYSAPSEFISPPRSSLAIRDRALRDA